MVIVRRTVGILPDTTERMSRPKSAVELRTSAAKKERPLSALLFRRYPALPPTIPRLQLDKVLQGAVTPQPFPLPTKPADTAESPKRKAFHPNRRGPEANPWSRERLAWDSLVAARVARDAWCRLRRLNAESVRNAKDAAAAEQRVHGVRHVRPRPPDSPEKPTKKPPVPRLPSRPPRRLRRRVVEPPPPEQQQQEPEDIELQIRLPHATVDVTGRANSSVLELKALLSLLTMHAAQKDETQPRLLASEFRLRPQQKGGVVNERASLAALVAKHQTSSFAVELSALGVSTSLYDDENLRREPSGYVIQPVPPKDDDRPNPNRRVRTPAEWAKLTLDLRDANRFIKGDRSRMLAKYECSRQHRKIAQITRAAPPKPLQPPPRGLAFYSEQFVALPPPKKRHPLIQRIEAWRVQQHRSVISSLQQSRGRKA